MNILIFAEQRNGSLHPAVYQMITAARHVSNEANITVCVVGMNVADLAKTLSGYNINTVQTVDDASLELYHPQPYTSAVVTAMKKAQAQIVLLPATFMGRDLAPRMAARTGSALATDCVNLKMEGDALIITRPAYTGKVTVDVKLAADRTKIVSVRPNTFAAAEQGGSATIESLSFAPSPDEQKLVNREWRSTSSGVKDVTEADIVVSGGRSLKSEENFKLLYDLAAVLDAAVGASRAACDAGFQPHSRQVGLTGKTVTPKLYIAIGIDGAIQHLAGMRGSKCIVAVNTKADAPIFSVADYGCVADLFTLTPLLTEEFKKVLR